MAHDRSNFSASRGSSRQRRSQPLADKLQTGSIESNSHPAKRHKGQQADFLQTGNGGIVANNVRTSIIGDDPTRHDHHVASFNNSTVAIDQSPTLTENLESNSSLDSFNSQTVLPAQPRRSSQQLISSSKSPQSNRHQFIGGPQTPPRPENKIKSPTKNSANCSNISSCQPSISTLVDFSSWVPGERSKCKNYLMMLAGSPPTWGESLWALVIEIIFLCMHENIPVTPVNDILFDLLNILRGPYTSEQFIAANITAMQKTESEDLDQCDLQKYSDCGGDVIYRASMAIDSYFHTILDILAVAATFTEKLDSLAKLVFQINSSGWMPTVLFVQHLSYDLLEKASFFRAEAAQKTEGRILAGVHYSVPQYSLICEALEGYMNLITLLAEATLSDLPEIVFIKPFLPEEIDRQNTNSAENTKDLQIFEETMEKLIRKIDQVVFTHKLILFRVADIILRCFASKVTTHWPLFISLFQRSKFHDLDHIVGYILNQSYDIPTKMMKKHESSQDDLSYYRREPKLSNQSCYSSRIERTLIPYKDDISNFLTFASINSNIQSMDSTKKSSSLSKEREKNENAWEKITQLTETALKPNNTRNLYTSTALLIKYKLINLEIILDHIPETLDQYRPFFNELQLSQENSCGLILESNSSKTSKNSSLETKLLYADINNDCPIAILLNGLVSVGDLDNSRKLMAHYPSINWCIKFPLVAHHFLRMLEMILGSDGKKIDFKDIKNFNTTIYASNDDESSIQVKKQISPDKKYFYPNWNANLKLFDPEQTNILLGIVGQTIFLSPTATFLLCCRCFETHSPVILSSLLCAPWDDKVRMITGYLLPALSLMQTPPPVLTEAVWKLITKWPVAQRFALYAQQETVSNSHSQDDMHGFMISNVAQVARYWMKRISKDFVKIFSRKLAKIALGNPIALLSHVVQTIMTYENLMIPILDSLRYLDEMAFDVLVYTVLKALDTMTLKGRAMKADGLNLEPWLVNASIFMSSLFRQQKCIDLSPFLSYLDHDKFDLADAQLLSDLIQQMTGIKAIMDWSSDVVQAWASSDCVALRIFVPQTVDSVDSIARLKKHIIQEDLHLRFLKQLRALYTSSSMETDWNDFETVERTSPTLLLATLQWRDRTKAFLMQYLLFLRLFCDYLPKFSDIDCFETEEPACKNSEAVEFWKLGHREMYFDPSIYLVSSEIEVKQMLIHKKVYESTQLWLQLLAEKSQDFAFPTPAELIRRALGGAEETRYVIYWLRHPTHAAKASIVAKELLEHVWAVCGMTENEAGLLGTLLGECLMLVETAGTPKAEEPLLEYTLRTLNSPVIDLIQVRNTLKLLQAIGSVFPANRGSYEPLLTALARHREDPSLRVMVLVVEGGLRTGMKAINRLTIASGKSSSYRKSTSLHTISTSTVLLSESALSGTNNSGDFETDVNNSSHDIPIITTNTTISADVGPNDLCNNPDRLPHTIKRLKRNGSCETAESLNDNGRARSFPESLPFPPNVNSAAAARITLTKNTETANNQ